MDSMNPVSARQLSFLALQPLTTDCSEPMDILPS